MGVPRFELLKFESSSFGDWMVEVGNLVLRKEGRNRENGRDGGCFEAVFYDVSL